MKQDEYILWKQWKVTRDPEKLNQLYNSFQPLIRHSVNRFKNAPIPTEAIEMEAKRLFLHGLVSYNPQKAQLNTHLVNQMKPLYRYVAKYQNVGYIPEVRVRKIGAYDMARRELEEGLDRPPTSMEIADKMGISIQEVTRLQNELRGDLVESLDDFSTIYQQSSPKKDALYYVYHDLDPRSKLVFEHLTGLTGRPQLKKATDIAEKLHIPAPNVRRIIETIGEKIEPFKDL